uniref:CCHC-type domain-containing protein n=1 Tax=Vitis vinifera TaxID=29760 RepID=A5BFV1_VITVI|nr:hypothetical protein VITISV_042575 [Vitis vinifera]
MATENFAQPTVPRFDGYYDHWAMLMENFLRSKEVNRAQLQALRKEFEILQMKEGEKVDEYFTKALTIANKMKTHEERMGQNVIVEKILRSMTPKLDYVRMNCHSGNARDEQALKVSYDERYEGRCRGRSFVRGCMKGRRSYFTNKAIVECFKCHKLGHFQYECPSWEKSANYAEFNEEVEILFMSYVEVNNLKRENVWFLDSGCSNHM